MTKDLFFVERTLWHHDVSVWAEWDWGQWLIGVTFADENFAHPLYHEVAIYLLPLRVGVTAYRRTR